MEVMIEKAVARSLEARQVPERHNHAARFFSPTVYRRVALIDRDRRWSYHEAVSGCGGRAKTPLHCPPGAEIATAGVLNRSVDDRGGARPPGWG